MKNLSNKKIIFSLLVILIFSGCGVIPHQIGEPFINTIETSGDNPFYIYKGKYENGHLFALSPNWENKFSREYGIVTDKLNQGRIIEILTKNQLYSIIDENEFKEQYKNNKQPNSFYLTDGIYASDCESLYDNTNNYIVKWKSDRKNLPIFETFKNYEVDTKRIVKTHDSKINSYGKSVLVSNQKTNIVSENFTDQYGKNYILNFIFFKNYYERAILLKNNYTNKDHEIILTKCSNEKINNRSPFDNVHISFNENSEITNLAKIDKGTNDFSIKNLRIGEPFPGKCEKLYKLQDFDGKSHQICKLETTLLGVPYIVQVDFVEGITVNVSFEAKHLPAKNLPVDLSSRFVMKNKNNIFDEIGIKKGELTKHTDNLVGKIEESLGKPVHTKTKIEYKNKLIDELSNDFSVEECKKQKSIFDKINKNFSKNISNISILNMGCNEILDKSKEFEKYLNSKCGNCNINRYIFNWSNYYLVDLVVDIPEYDESPGALANIKVSYSTKEIKKWYNDFKDRKKKNIDINNDDYKLEIEKVRNSVEQEKLNDF